MIRKSEKIAVVLIRKAVHSDYAIDTSLFAVMNWAE